MDPITLKWTVAKVAQRWAHEYRGELAEIAVNGRKLTATGHHPFWVVAGSDLQSRPEPRHCEAKEAIATPTLTGRWVEARDLQLGDVIVVRTSDGFAKIEAIRTWHSEQVVYNLEVEGLHTFAAGEDGVWVHNGRSYAKRLTEKAKERLAKKFAKLVNAGKSMNWGKLTPKQQRNVKEYAVDNKLVNANLLHGNSHATTSSARGYSLRERNSGEVLKYGETTQPGTTRYSKTYLAKHNAEMVFEAKGAKKKMHGWQHDAILKFIQQFGRRPLLNKSNF